MRTSDFDYDLPEDLIAQRPLPQRTASRLLHVSRDNQNFDDKYFNELRALLNPGDLLVFNDTRVLPARLFGQKASGGHIEILLERILDEHKILAHIRASKSPKPDSYLLLPEGVRALVVGRRDELFELLFECTDTVLEYLERVGRMPLPPYISRDADMDDSDRYQTVYARHRGAVAAPTAGLHFDQPLLDELSAYGVQLAHVTLHVGAGTFQPVRMEHVHEHKMHSEYVEVPTAACDAVKVAKESGKKVIAVGTTVVRSLEAASVSGVLQPFSGETNLFITPGYRFHDIDALITNFHLPRSSLLMLVCAFGGYERVMRAYQQAIWRRYRFYSYGDAMLVEREE